MPRTSRLLIQTVNAVTIATFTDGSVIDMQHIDNIREELLELMDKRDRARLVVQMSKVHHFSSSALGMLVELQAAAKKCKGKLILCGLRPEIRKVFKITKLEKKFSFAETEKDALAKLA